MWRSLRGHQGSLEVKIIDFYNFVTQIRIAWNSKLGRCDYHLASKNLKANLKSSEFGGGKICKNHWIYMKLCRCIPRLCQNLWKHCGGAFKITFQRFKDVQVIFWCQEILKFPNFQMSPWVHQQKEPSVLVCNESIKQHANFQEGFKIEPFYCWVPCLPWAHGIIYCTYQNASKGIIFIEQRMVYVWNSTCFSFCTVGALLFFSIFSVLYSLYLVVLTMKKILH